MNIITIMIIFQDDKETCLSVASRLGFFEIALLLSEKGAEINVADKVFILELYKYRK